MANERDRLLIGETGVACLAKQSRLQVRVLPDAVWTESER